MSSFDYELRYLKAGISELETYLLSKELYWPIGVRASRGEKGYPRMTLGNLLLSLVKANALAKMTLQKDNLADVTLRIDTIRNDWRSAWGKKASAEFRSRINLWRNYLDEYRQHPESHFDRYAYEVGRRVLLQLLKPDADDVQEAETLLLESLDQYLRAVITPGEFIWDAELLSVFPREDYWYLFGNLQR